MPSHPLDSADRKTMKCAPHLVQPRLLSSARTSRCIELAGCSLTPIGTTPKRADNVVARGIPARIGILPKVRMFLTHVPLLANGANPRNRVLAQFTRFASQSLRQKCSRVQRHLFFGRLRASACDSYFCDPNSSRPAGQTTVNRKMHSGGMLPSAPLQHAKGTNLRASCSYGLPQNL